MHSLGANLAGVLALILVSCASLAPPAPPGVPPSADVPAEAAPQKSITEVSPLPPAAPEVAVEPGKPAADPIPRVLFAYRSVALPEDALPKLTDIAEALKADRLRHVTLVAYADYVGSREFNVARSGSRASAVKEALLKLGVRATQIRKSLRGIETLPPSGCEGESCRQMARRVELHLSPLRQR